MPDTFDVFEPSVTGFHHPDKPRHRPNGPSVEYLFRVLTHPVAVSHFGGSEVVPQAGEEESAFVGLSYKLSHLADEGWTIVESDLPQFVQLFDGKWGYKIRILMERAI